MEVNKFNIPVINENKNYQRPNEMIWHSQDDNSYLYKKIRYDRSSRKNKFIYDLFENFIKKYEKK